jgi:hypothetical protein
MAASNSGPDSSRSRSHTSLQGNSSASQAATNGSFDDASTLVDADDGWEASAVAAGLRGATTGSAAEIAVEGNVGKIDMNSADGVAAMACGPLSGDGADGSA